MKKTLDLALLGPLHIVVDGESLDSLVSLKAQAILCYLLFQKRSLPRQTLAATFWGDMNEEDARRNLRGVVMKLRQGLEPFLHISNYEIGFNHESLHRVDVVQLEQAVALGELDLLETAVSRYRDEFLSGFVVRDAPEFESWQERERARVHQLVLTAYDQLLALYEAQQRWEDGIVHCRRQIEIEPTREASHQTLMRFLAMNEQRNRALDQFETLRTILAHEFGVEVSPESTQLAEAIRQGELKGATLVYARPAPNPTPFIAGPPITTPAHFFGRETIVKRLFRLFQKRPFQNGAIIGPRRSGKTSLLHYLRTLPTAAPQQKRPEQQRDWLPEPAQYRWVFIDFQDARLGDLNRLLHTMLRQMGLSAPEPCDLEQFLDIVGDELVDPTIILFDEIGVALSRYGETLDDAFWESLRSLATNQVNGRLGFVLSSHQQPWELATHNGYGSPFFNIFGYTAVLGALQEDAARAMIAQSPLPFSESDTAWILEQSQLWPMPLQILCRERLITLEEGEQGNAWRMDALQQVAPFLPKAEQ